MDDYLTYQGEELEEGEDKHQEVDREEILLTIINNMIHYCQQYQLPILNDPLMFSKLKKKFIN